MAAESDETLTEVTWTVPPGNPELERSFVAELACSPILARLLSNRGVASVEQAKEFLALKLTDLVPPDAFAAMYAAERYRTKSLRCRDCSHDASCTGLAVNLIRAQGFGVLEPID